jgi:hypothetical protein
VSPEYDADTDYESDSASTANWPKLPDFFDGLVFALHEQLPSAMRKKLRRYIVSAKGCEPNIKKSLLFSMNKNKTSPTIQFTDQILFAYFKLFIDCP